MLANFMVTGSMLMRKYGGVQLWYGIESDSSFTTADVFISSDLRVQAEKSWKDKCNNDPDHTRFMPSMKETVLDADVNLMQMLLTAERRRFMELYRKRFGIQHGIACLSAHGSDHKQDWYYVDGKRTLRLQNWINRMDGVYTVLVLASCNVRGMTPSSNSSLLLVPDTSYSVGGFEDGDSHFSLIHPTEGDMEYIIEYEANRLQDQIGA